MEDPSPPPDPPSAPAAVELLTLGLTVAAALAVCVAAGFAVDRWLGTQPLFTVVGLVVGLGAAATIAVTRIRKYL